jgi:hypothetical protein
MGEASRLLPNKPNPATLWRWRTKGIRGVRLTTVMVGGRRFVDTAELDRFIAAVSAASEAISAERAPVSAKSKPRRSAEMSRRLKRAGLAR